MNEKVPYLKNPSLEKRKSLLVNMSIVWTCMILAGMFLIPTLVFGFYIDEKVNDGLVSIKNLAIIVESNTTDIKKIKEISLIKNELDKALD